MIKTMEQIFGYAVFTTSLLTYLEEYSKVDRKVENLLGVWRKGPTSLAVLLHVNLFSLEMYYISP